MRVLFSLEGREGGQTRRAIAALPFDTVDIVAVDPNADEIERVTGLVERAGGTVQVTAVDGDDLLVAFETIGHTMAQHRDTASRRMCSVNAGKDENLLSAAGLLACLHEGVEVHYLDEGGHTVLPVLTEMPLREVLTQRERKALAAFPAEGVPVRGVGSVDARALNGLKKRGLLHKDGDRLALTPQGVAYQEHVR